MSQLNYEKIIKEVLHEIKNLKKKLKEVHSTCHQSIAIIGMSGRFPEDCKVFDNSFWEFLKKGKNAIRLIPEKRWNVEPYYNEERYLPEYTYSCHGSFLSGVKEFDAAFFGISPREALYIDPQHRFMLECMWEAIEDAGIPPKSLKGSNAGVFVAQSSDDYHQLINTLERRKHLDYYSGTGTSRSMLAGRISYVLGIHGPSLQVDTSCSSSLTAIHLAIQSLRNCECDTALVGGVQMNLSPLSSILRSRTQALSPDGQCKTFSKDANGFVQGEGIGVLVLRRLNDEIDQKDPIHCVIEGSAINHDGASAGLTAPNEIAQVDVIQRTLKNANINSSAVQYIETHGTGTILGDPIEINALNTVYGQDRKDPVWLGSVKSNIGHLEAAAGVASVIKTVLALKNQSIPAHQYTSDLNPHIDWDNIPFKLTDKTIPMEPTTQGFFAAVSSFGMSGTNAHLILRKFELQDEIFDLYNEPQIFILSAKNHHALNNLVERYIPFLGETLSSLSDICYTIAIGRNHFKVRLALLVSSIDELIEKLKEWVNTSKDLPKKEIYLTYGQELSSEKINQFFKAFPSIQAIHQSLSEKLTEPHATHKTIETFVRKLGIVTETLQDDSNKPAPEICINTKDIFSDLHVFLKLLIDMYLQGTNIDWRLLYEGKKVRRIHLPPYAFDRKEYWPEEIRE